MRTGRLLLAGVIVCAALAGCGPTVKPPSPAYASPETTWATLQKAEADGDHRAFINGLTPECQKDVVGRMAFSVVMVRSSKAPDAAKQQEQLKPLFAVLDRHGLTAEATMDVAAGIERVMKEGLKEEPDAEKRFTAIGAAMEQGRAKVAELVKDPVEFWVSLREVLAKMPEEFRSNFKPRGLTSKLENVKVEGDRATATVATKETNLPHPIDLPLTFQKIGGEWRADIFKPGKR